uniref:Uncharacterized protein n=1 Tax=Bactrocera dorsalis TaxID=27457 RepID=A0A034V1X8_BACDO
MHNISLDLNLGQHSNNNNFNINNNNSNLSTSTSDSNDNECIFNCSNTNVLLISNNNNNNTKTGRQMMAAQETKTADESVKGDVASANITNTSGGVIVGVVRTHNRDDIMYNAEEATRQTASGLHVTGGILVDESASYETDEEAERMQLNPSGDEGWDDEYDDDDDDEDVDEDDDEMDDAYEDEGEEADAVAAPYIGSAATVDVAAQERGSTTYEALPEAKGLVQALVGDENESVKNMPDILKTKSIAAGASKIEDEEEDMGFDEDDERIAIIVERQRGNANDNDKGFMNEEGSGSSGGAYRRTEANRYKNNRFRLDYAEKYRRKQQKLQTEYTNRGVADAREGSGNFANDDDDDDDDSENYGTDGNVEDPAIDSENTNVEAPNGVVEDIEQVENPEEQFVLG